MTVKEELTSSEIANLWTAYIDNSAMSIKLKYVLHIMEDTEILPIVQKTNQLSENNLIQFNQIFDKEKYSAPIGFTDSDVHLAAPRLYSDSFFLVFLQNKMDMNLNAYSMGLSHSTRSDIRNFFQQSLAASIEIFKEATDLMLEKGIYVRPPYIPTPKTVDMTERQNFLTGWLGKRRPLTAIEIDQLFFNISRNALGHALLLGYSQVAKLKEVREHMRRGADIAKKHIHLFSSILLEEDIPAPMLWASKIEDTSVSPFSDKLLMFEVTGTTQAGVGYYGRSLASAQRRDLGAQYLKVLTDSILYGEDGGNITIKNAWLEEPPQAINFRKKVKG
ncbi:DUF3231 family protein [Bacillus sp. BRMEA1]|uniref:DUF3231 family protein n=1 Tax=Neobacillus endophyticus TaxID=2738405 RepID=UPI0015631EE9|nr:DUF3231 family protein [Neobacillus endophyticus]NRD77052.1 DUF3231 family protein [Neobacillus endophyticus]